MIKTAFGLIALALVTVSTSAWAACDCKSNADCFSGYYCKPVQNGCGSSNFTGWCTSVSHGSGSGVQPPEMPLKAPGGPKPEQSQQFRQ